MIITHHGNQFFKIQFGDMTVAVNPISKDSKLKSSRFGADICLVSVNHPDFNGSDQLSFGDKEPLVISNPGEYETKGVFIKGFASTSKYGGEDRINTIYTFTLDSISMCFFGAINSTELSSEAKEALEEVDIVFVPVGGNGTLNAHEAYRLAVGAEPKLIIPMGYDTGEKEALKVFLKEGSAEGMKPLDKLTIKKKDLEGKEGEIVIVSDS